MNIGRENSPTRRPGARPRLFISYRRRFDHASARLLKEQLTEAFGEGAVFRDVDDIRPGDAFPESIRKAVEACDAFLPLVSPGWLGVIGELRDPEDFVRREIAAALGRPAPVIPVLLGGASMPEPEDLPDEIKDLASRHACELSDSRWDYDVRRLIEVIRALTRSRAPDSLAARAWDAARSLFATWPRRAAFAGLVAFAAYAAYLYRGADLPHDGGKIPPTPEPPPTYERCLDRLRAAGPREVTVRTPTDDKPFDETIIVWKDEYKLVSPPPPGGFPILVKLTDAGRDIGAVSLTFLRGDYRGGGVVFRVSEVVEPPCARVTDYFNRGSHTKAEVYNWELLTVRLGGRYYLLRLGDNGDLLIARLTREAER